MKRFLSEIIGLAMLLTLAGAAWAESATGTEQTLTGTVTCASRISGRYTCHKGQTLMTCTVACVDRGSNYALLVNGNSAFLLEGDTSKLDQYAGGPATVTGQVEAGENIMMVESVTKARKLGHIESVAQTVSDAPASAAK
jgi:hypothetical protein